MAVRLKVEGFEKAQDMLRKLPIEIRGNVVKSGLRSAGRVVVKDAKAIVPIGDDDDTKHLRDTLGVVVKDGKVGPFAVVGPQRPAGAHGHLVEGAGGDDYQNIDVRHHSHGQPTGVILRKQPFIGIAAVSTEQQQLRVLHDAIIRAVERVTR